MEMNKDKEQSKITIDSINKKLIIECNRNLHCSSITKTTNTKTLT